MSYVSIFIHTKKRQGFAHHCNKWLIPNSFIYSTVSSNWPYIDYPKFRKAIAFCKNTEEIIVLNGTSSLFDSEQKCKQRFSRLCTFRFRVQVEPVQRNFGQIIWLKLPFKILHQWKSSSHFERFLWRGRLRIQMIVWEYGQILFESTTHFSSNGSIHRAEVQLHLEFIFVWSKLNFE